jgi:predicted ATPase
MEQLAAPGSILVTAQTHKLAAGYFEFKPLGKTQIKGMEEPLNVYEVLGAGPLRTRLQVSAHRGLTRFVGRHSEMDQLRRTLDQAKAGHGQIVGVMGEPGVGKSRLFYEFKLTSQSGCLVLEAFSVSHGKASPYVPVIELLRSYFQIQSQDDDRSRREKVIGKVLGLDRSLEDTLPYFFALLGIEDPTLSLSQMDAQIRRRRTFEALKRLFLRESLTQPLILIFEDLHWIDSETQGFLDLLTESLATARILLLANYRPEYRHEWGTKTYYTQLRLAPLDREQAEELLTFLLGSEVTLRSLKQLILAKTEGTPFFMEEVVQTLAEEGVLIGDRGNYRLEKAPTELHISPTVQGVLAARIDRLAAGEKELLHQLAVIGREFPLSLVRQVVPQPEEELYRLLASLQRKEFLYEQPAFPEVEYIFKHALTQEVAYGSVLQDRRKALHEQTAKAVEALYSENLDDHYSELAHHYSRSENREKAVEYLQFAGQQAVHRSANAEAITHLTAALELLKTLPDTLERAQQELTLLIALGPAFYAIKGPGAPEVEQVYTHAQELCQQVGETPHLFPVLRGLYSFHLTRGAFRTGHELGKQFLSLTQRIQDPTFLPEAHFVVGQTLFFFGEFSAARQYYEESIAFYDPKQHRSQAFLYGQDSGVFCRAQVALDLWSLGYPDQAQQRSQEALTLARELAHPMSLAFALLFAAFLHVFRREEQAAHELAEALIRLCTDQGNPHLLPYGTATQGWAVAEQEGGEEGITQIRQGLAALRALGAEINRPTLLAWLAEAYQRAGRVEEGLRTLDEALEVVRQNEERWYEAELYRLKGELTLAPSSVQRLASSVANPQSPIPNPQTEAEACFQKAIEIAREQQAKSWELRATTCLARLWQRQGKKTEARQLLSEIYGWFTEGFDTKDLQEAKALLEELSH